MDEIELTQLFVQYAETQKKLSELKAQIEFEILLRAESVKIAGVSATFYKPSLGTPNYEYAVQSYLESHPIDNEGEYLDQFTTTTKSVRWKEVCENLNVIAEPGELKPARVTIK